jgi:hypothetical protein
MNVYASGSEAEAKALELSLALPGMLTTWTLAQPAVLGFTPADGKPIAAISDIATTQPDAAISLDASASYDPAQPGATLNYRWSFGDGAQAQGVATQHAWASVGDYPLTLTVSDAAGSRTITKTIHVTGAPVLITNPYQGNPQNGVPPANPAMTLPQPEVNTPGAPSGGASVSPAGSPASAPWWLWVVFAVVGVLALSLIVFGVSMARKPALSTAAGVASPEAEAERQRREQALRGLLAPHAPDDIPPDRVDRSE